MTRPQDSRCFLRPPRSAQVIVGGGRKKQGHDRCEPKKSGGCSGISAQAANLVIDGRG